jgi:hypothetical protein
VKVEEGFALRKKMSFAQRFNATETGLFIQRRFGG